jgi:hypothetical protein
VIADGDQLAVIRDQARLTAGVASDVAQSQGLKRARLATEHVQRDMIKQAAAAAANIRRAEEELR